MPDEETMREGGLEKWARAEAAKWNVLMWKFRSPFKKGVPDDILFYDGRSMLVEFKSPSGKGRLSAKQKEQIAILRSYGMTVVVCHNKALFNSALQQLIMGTKK